MGYTHYWYRTKEIDQFNFDCIVNDFSKFLPLFKVLDIQLADGNGMGKPELSNDLVCFNGKDNCGHKENKQVSIPWPSNNIKSGVAVGSNQALSGQWFAGVTLNQRTCNGSCSYETFYFPRVDENSHTVDRVAYRKENGENVYTDPMKVGKYFNCTKTVFRPYDLAVCVFLIIAKHHLGTKIFVSSDGEMPQWKDALQMVKNALNYDSEFKLQ